MNKLKKLGFLKNKSYNIISRFLLSSVIVISSFYIAPIIINFTDNSFDGCYSHMLYCMAFRHSELENLNTEVCRVLNKDSLNIYTVRNHSDADYKKGTHRGEDLYEMNGYIVHYFSDEKIKKLVKGFKNISIDHFDEGSFPRKLSLVINQKI